MYGVATVYTSVTINQRVQDISRHVEKTETPDVSPPSHGQGYSSHGQVSICQPTEKVRFHENLLFGRYILNRPQV